MKRRLRPWKLLSTPGVVRLRAVNIPKTSANDSIPSWQIEHQEKARHEWNRGAPRIYGELFQRDFAHEFGAHDLANLQPFDCGRALLIGIA
jgi:hypothetical protein